MTPKITFVALCMIIGCFHRTLCATYSNVVVRSGSEIIPVEYLNYGGPYAYTGPQISQIATAPFEPLISLPNARPCVAPCVIANAPVAGLAPIPATANAQIVAYKPPVANVPIVLANTDDSAGYQYAYAVYDEGTGDKKAQSEQSDGSVVQGQYSFIQPDGYRREVVYTADDLKGFNAIVKTVAPEPPKTEASEESKEIKESPCNEPKKEQLVEAPKSEEKPTESSEEITETIVNTEPANTESIETKTEEKSIEETAPPTTESIKPDVDTNVISYSDIIDCLQSKRIANAKSISPLTYVLIPALGNVQRPC